MKTTDKDITALLDRVFDPEIPVLTIRDLGIVRQVETDGNKITVTITPTYSGCPAMDVIEREVRQVLQEAGYEVEVKTTLSPAWTTDWISEEGRKKMEEYGIAPPVKGSSDKRALFGKAPKVKCPHCKSENTEMVSLFGSTACKAQYKCLDCWEPFDYFKCL